MDNCGWNRRKRLYWCRTRDIYDPFFLIFGNGRWRPLARWHCKRSKFFVPSPLVAPTQCWWRYGSGRGGMILLESARPTSRPIVPAAPLHHLRLSRSWRRWRRWRKRIILSKSEEYIHYSLHQQSVNDHCATRARGECTTMAPALRAGGRFRCGK